MLTCADGQIGRNFLTPEIFKAAQDRLEHREQGDNIEPVRLKRNLLTSQTLCFNLFLPQRQANCSAATAIWSSILPSEIGRVTAVKVEHSPGRRHPEQGIGDKSAFDTLVEYRRKGVDETGILAIETKYTDSFSPPQNPAKPYQPIVGTDQTDRQRARNAMIRGGVMTQEGWDRAQQMPTEQLWRTHALAESMRNRTCTHVTYIVLHAAGDAECTRVLPAYQKCLTNGACCRQCFVSVTLEDFVAKAMAALSGSERQLLEHFHARYLDWRAVEQEVRDARRSS